MAGREKSGNEILLEQLTLRVTQLTHEQKAKEAIVKELNQQIIIAERESESRIEKAKIQADIEVSLLQKAVAPLKDLQATCDRLRKDIETLKQDKLIAVTEIKEAKSGAIKEADAVLVKSTGKLAKIEASIEECKKKVAGL